jgi:hypothetical protein
MSVNPYFSTWNTWASNMVPVLERYGPIPKPMEEDSWKKWASDVVLLDFGAPLPVGFNDWKEWAARLIEVVNDGF